MLDSEGAFILSVTFSVVIVLLLFFIGVNVYLTRQSLQTLLFPEGIPQVLRLCPHCRRQVPALATVCSMCGRESEPWVSQEGRWSRTDDEGKRVYLDSQTRRWVEVPAPDA